MVRISKDSIVCEAHEFPMRSYMEQKEVPSFANEPAERYCTNVWKPNPVVPMFDQFEHEFGGGDWGVAECARLDVSQHPRRTSYPVEANLGVGGGGKTHRNLVDKGLQRIVYISPSWKLARETERGLPRQRVGSCSGGRPEMWSRRSLRQRHRGTRCRKCGWRRRNLRSAFQATSTSSAATLASSCRPSARLGRPPTPFNAKDL